MLHADYKDFRRPVKTVITTPQPEDIYQRNAGGSFDNPAYESGVSKQSRVDQLPLQRESVISPARREDDQENQRQSVISPLRRASVQPNFDHFNIYHS